MPTHTRGTLSVLLGLGVVACERGPSPRPALEAQDTPAQSTAGASASQAGVKLSVARSPALGAYVTDVSGRALYLLETEGGTGGCVDACLGIWPPLVTGQAPPEPADTSLVPRLLGTTKRRDGMTQATYAGHALYYYLGDRAPGQTLGQHVEDSWGEWYLVSPTGAKVRDDRSRGGREGREHDD